MLNYYYKDSITNFLQKSTDETIGSITRSNLFDSKLTQNKSWTEQIIILKQAIRDLEGTIFFEFSIPRMGKRVDVLVLIKSIVFVIEFKVGEYNYHSHQIDQVWDYALDLKNFHEPSHTALMVPVLVSTEANASTYTIATTSHNDNLILPLKVNKHLLKDAINSVLLFFGEGKKIDNKAFEAGRYSPTPTIIEAALALYNNHSVNEITRSDANATNLRETTNAINAIIHKAKNEERKIICFITGVPGAGKTLVGLKIATGQLDENKTTSSVYLSGNGPLVKILQEALTRNRYESEKRQGRKTRKGEIKSQVKLFIQNVHHYRDEYLRDKKAPYDHVAIFDEAQRAWNKEQTVKFMKQKKNQQNFDASEPEFLISCLDRHKDWAVIVCLVGGGQEINTGEAGISEWLDAVFTKFENWEVYISPNLTDSEYSAVNSIKPLDDKSKIHYDPNLHLAVSMRSFRAESLSALVKSILDQNIHTAEDQYSKIKDNYPIAITRDLQKAKNWLKEKARGSERYGLVVSSQGERLKPLAINVKAPMDPVNWFLDGKDDVRSSYYLEDVATEFHVQGLELDWACITWDGDLRYSSGGWQTFSFVGNKWQNILKEERKKYLINAYRVLLTRARQGMVIVVPEGSINDHTRKPEFYDATFEYLKSVGFDIL